MRKVLKNIYYFLPVQLLLLHFRKYQLLLAFWLILVATLTGNFAAHFGASSLFLAPEYLGNINFVSMLLLGCAMAVFVMAWHITTFIIHSKRIPFLGATRQAFLIYCFNNAIIPVAFLVFYSIVTIRFQWYNEHSTIKTIVLLQLGFYMGFLLVVLVSFAYFFRVGRDMLKLALSKITNPALIRGIIPYDTLDFELDILRAQTYISGHLKLKRFDQLEPYAPRLLNTVLRRHHRNAIFATLFSYVLLLVLGIFMEEPLLRIPAGAGFLILFAITMGVVGAVKYFLKSWEAIGWVLFAVLLSLMVKYRIFDLRSIAYGLDYHTAANQQEPAYNYEHLRQLFTPQRYQQDIYTEEGRLDKWKKNVSNGSNPPLVVVTISGGGSRAAYWTFHTLQYIDSLSKGMLFTNTTLITGASGGMIGASYWRGIHDEYKQGEIKDPYATRYLDNVGKDLLNSIIFSFVSVDLVSPFNKISLAGYSYTKDRGYAMEQELIRNTEGVLDKKIGDYKQAEANATIPAMIINGTIINDGRKLMISGQPISYLTRPVYSIADTTHPAIDAIDFAAFFSAQNPYNLRITSALRMNATFPYILPVVKLPSQPYINIMDAGLRDNFGSEVASRYVLALQKWLLNNTRDIIFLEIRDTREYDVSPISDQTGSLSKMIADPAFIIQDRWEAFQSYHHNYLKDYMEQAMKGRIHFVTMQYMPQEAKNLAELNFHLTQKEKEDIYRSIYNPINQAAVTNILQLLHP